MLSDKTKVDQAMQDENSKLIEMNNRICDLYIKYCLEAFGINTGNCQNNELSFETMETSSLAQSFELKDASDCLSDKDTNDVYKSCVQETYEDPIQKEPIPRPHQHYDRQVSSHSNLN